MLSPQPGRVEILAANKHTNSKSLPLAKGVRRQPGGIHAPGQVRNTQLAASNIQDKSAVSSPQSAK